MSRIAVLSVALFSLVPSAAFAMSNTTSCLLKDAVTIKGQNFVGIEQLKENCGQDFTEVSRLNEDGITFIVVEDDSGTMAIATDDLFLMNFNENNEDAVGYVAKKAVEIAVEKVIEKVVKEVVKENQRQADRQVEREVNADRTGNGDRYGSRTHDKNRN